MNKKRIKKLLSLEYKTKRTQSKELNKELKELKEEIIEIYEYKGETIKENGITIFPTYYSTLKEKDIIDIEDKELFLKLKEEEKKTKEKMNKLKEKYQVKKLVNIIFQKGDE